MQTKSEVKQAILCDWNRYPDYQKESNMLQKNRLWQEIRHGRLNASMRNAVMVKTHDGY